MRCSVLLVSFSFVLMRFACRSLRAAAEAAADTAATDGLYTEAQAARGRAIYAKRCALCHGDQLQGNPAPPLTGAAVRAVVEPSAAHRRRLHVPDPHHHAAAHGAHAPAAGDGRRGGVPPLRERLSGRRRGARHRLAAAEDPDALGDRRSRERRGSRPSSSPARPAPASRAAGRPRRSSTPPRRRAATGCTTRATTPARATRRSTRSIATTRRVCRRCARSSSATR